VRIERITRLGRLGEDLVAERLAGQGYKVENLNLTHRQHYPFGDLLATKNGERYFIGVKARNEMRQGRIGLNRDVPDRKFTQVIFAPIGYPTGRLSLIAAQDW
jgi:Holliday junction resolvase-like predicted endonuclease